MDRKQILKEYIKYQIKKAILEQDQNAAIDPGRIGKVEYYTESTPLIAKALRILMSDTYRPFIKDIQIISPKPSTYKVTLNNDYFFYLRYNDKAMTATVEGKNYDLTAIEDAQRASNAITNLLKFSAANITKEQSGDNSELSSAEGGGFASGGMGPDPDMEGGEGESEDGEDIPDNNGSELGATDNAPGFDVDKILGTNEK